MDDCTAIWFIQRVGLEVRLIDYYETSGEGLAHYVSVLKSKGYQYGKHYMPHDLEVRELGTGKSRWHVLLGMGIRGEVVKRSGVEDGINAVRAMMTRFWIDRNRCSWGLKCLRNYRSEWDSKNKVYRTRPKHDWASHAADAIRTFAMGVRESDRGMKRYLQSSGRSSADINSLRNFLSDAEKKKLRKEFDDKTSAFLKSYSDRGEDEDDIDADVYNDFFKDLNTKLRKQARGYGKARGDYIKAQEKLAEAMSTPNKKLIDNRVNAYYGAVRGTKGSGFGSAGGGTR